MSCFLYVILIMNTDFHCTSKKPDFLCHSSSLSLVTIIWIGEKQDVTQFTKANIHVLYSALKFDWTAEFWGGFEMRKKNGEKVLKQFYVRTNCWYGTRMNQSDLGNYMFMFVLCCHEMFQKYKTVFIHSEYLFFLYSFVFSQLNFILFLLSFQIPIH